MALTKEQLSGFLEQAKVQEAIAELNCHKATTALEQAHATHNRAIGARSVMEQLLPLMPDPEPEKQSPEPDKDKDASSATTTDDPVVNS